MDAREAPFEIPLAGRPVSRCCVTFSFQIDFWQDKEGYTADLSVQIVIERPFKVYDADGEWQLDPENPMGLGRALGILHKTVDRAIALGSGELDIVFTDGSRLFVPSDSTYEAWDLATSKGITGLRLVSMPGGHLAVWNSPG